MSFADKEHKANVVTVLHNSVATLDEYFLGLERQASTINQVVLVDNASTDNTIAHAREWASRTSLNALVIESDNSGFAGGYLVGGRALSEDDLPTLCLNPDVSLGEHVLADCLELLASDPTVGIVTAPLILPDGSADPASDRRHPSLLGASVYAVLGKLTPRSVRYNAVADDLATASASGSRPVEATTGALMLVSRTFRAPADGIFDTDYWMYGEDLQLCIDAQRSGLSVMMSDSAPSTHAKGASSGLPRSRRSNIEFHRAMFTYYEKNMGGPAAARALMRVAVAGRLVISLASSAVIRAARRRRRAQ